jgi:uncharacterized protein (DUF58 family)
VTWRAAALLLLALVLIAAGAATPLLYPAGIALVAALTVAVLIDSRRAPGAGQLSARREHDTTLSLGVANTVRLHIGSRRSSGLLVRDECPAAAHPSATRWRVRAPCEITYTVTPRARGELRFGRSIVRAPGPWGLGWRQTACPSESRAGIDADIASIRVYEALARRGQLAEIGVRTLRLRTEGTEFERIRDAVPDDPLRSINWRATARTGRLMATELMPERAQPVVVCLDHGRLMGVGAGELTKLDHAINAALLLVHVALRTGDRAGLLAFADGVTATLTPRSGAAQLRRFLDSVRPLRAGESEADYDEAFTFLSGWQRRRALVVVFTDLLDADQGTALVRQCLRARRRHVPLVVTVRDPALDALTRRAPRTSTDAYTRAVAGGLAAERADIVEHLARAGVETIDADASTLSPRVVNRYLELKRRAVL